MQEPENILWEKRAKKIAGRKKDAKTPKVMIFAVHTRHHLFLEEIHLNRPSHE